MVKTIRVSEEYHEWLHGHKRDGETMEGLTTRCSPTTPMISTLSAFQSKRTDRRVYSSLSTCPTVTVNGTVSTRS